MTTLTNGIESPLRKELSDGLDRFKLYVHFYTGIPEVSAEAVLEKRRDEIKRVSHLEVRGANFKVCLEPIIVWGIEVIKSGLSDIAHMCRINKSPAEGKTGG